MTVRSQIITARDATEFLTGQWATKPAEVGFSYAADELRRYTTRQLLGMAHDVADEIDRRRASKPGATVYTFHRASDHAILATAAPGTLQTVAAKIAEAISRDDETRRAYVHNGLGVIAAGLCRAGVWHDILRDDYMGFDAKARALRAAEGYANDERKEQAQ